MLATMSTVASIGGLTVWSSQCLAFLRYFFWLRTLKKRGILPPEYDRWSTTTKPPQYKWHNYRMLLAKIQPLPALVGFITSFFIIFIFPSATWWNGDFKNTKLATAYAGVSYLAPFTLLSISAIPVTDC